MGVMVVSEPTSIPNETALSDTIPFSDTVAVHKETVSAIDAPCITDLATVVDAAPVAAAPRKNAMGDMVVSKPTSTPNEPALSDTIPFPDIATVPKETVSAIDAPCITDLATYEAPFDDTIRAKVPVQHPVAIDETPVATLNVAVVEEIHQSATYGAGKVWFDARKGNEEILSGPKIDCPVTTHVPFMSNDETISEDTQTLTFSVSGQTEIDEENLKGFTQVERRRSKNSSSKYSLNEGTEDVQLFYDVGYSSHPMITRSHSRKPQNETDYYLYQVDERFDSPHKLEAALRRFKLTHPEETTYRPYLKRAIRFHNRYNRSLSASIGIPSQNFNC
ncbi:unnamed protein product [Cuscuta europaea]|uniref:Uncharacterized protein n=1 Tax=Cuscuta europaea TaxID=41803 RepID=A0A9P0YR95_CUSEU|nr:unnamed protein product [Cuscuta europaea]